MFLVSLIIKQILTVNKVTFLLLFVKPENGTETLTQTLAYILN